MRHLTYAEKSLFIDDAAASCLLEYLTALSDADGSDIVRLNAVDVDGNPVEASLFLNAHSEVVVETTPVDFLDPENDRAVEYMRRRIDLARHPRPVQPSGDVPPTMIDL